MSNLSEYELSLDFEDELEIQMGHICALNYCWEYKLGEIFWIDPFNPEYTEDELLNFEELI